MTIVLFGATGSIGQQTIEVIHRLGHKLVGISFYHNEQVAATINAKYKFSPINIRKSNVKSYEDLIVKSKPDMIVNAIVGFSGLEITLLAIKHKIDIALANKESLVTAGRFIMPMAKKNKVHLYPIDSEHASLYQILKQVNKPFHHLFITASGGPFYNYSASELAKVSYKQAVKHPTWNMGWKISIDSATLVNKCFEMMEAYWYFGSKNVTPLYHPQSFIHAIVEFSDKTKYVFASKPDMRLPIKLALTKFKDNSTDVKSFTRSKYKLEPIDGMKHLPIKWGYYCLKNPKSTLPIIINSANDWATMAFKRGNISFKEITSTIDECIHKFSHKKVSNVSQVFKLNNLIVDYLNNSQNQ